ncbi:hypothetical protein ES708_27666 [subsurface metagenome]
MPNGQEPDWLQWVYDKQDELKGDTEIVDLWLFNATNEVVRDAKDLMVSFEDALGVYQDEHEGEFVVKTDDIMEELGDSIADIVWDAGWEADRIERAAQEGVDIISRLLIDTGAGAWDETGFGLLDFEFDIGDLLFEGTLIIGETEMTGWEAIAAFPSMMWSLFTLDFDTFVEQGMKMYRLQQKLGEKIRDEVAKKA